MEKIMKTIKRNLNFGIVCLILTLVFVSAASAQISSSLVVLTGDDLNLVVPKSFYFAGQSAETQMRNSAAAKIGENRFIIAGMVDTSGYSTEISGKYEGFFITDSPVMIGNKKLATGAYGFGFSQNGKINIFDLSSKQILSTATKIDTEMKRPRPLMMVSEAKAVRLYKGKSYVRISPLPAPHRKY
jgi:hypothetical protein